jgi:hypothetical protein
VGIGVKKVGTWESLTQGGAKYHTGQTKDMGVPVIHHGSYVCDRNLLHLVQV